MIIMCSHCRSHTSALDTYFAHEVDYCEFWLAILCLYFKVIYPHQKLDIERMTNWTMLALL